MTNDIHRSGMVRRYHSNPDLVHLGDTLAHHHGQVAQIIFEFWQGDPPIDLIYEALHHDCGELMVGDMSALAKAGNSALAQMLDVSESKARAVMGCPDLGLTPKERRWLKFADRLQAYRHVNHVAPHILASNGWPEAWDWLVKEADALGIKGDLA